MSEPKHGYFLTCKHDDSGVGVLAVITDGHPQRGHTDVTVLSVKVVPYGDDPEVWFREQIRLRPWEDDE